VTREREQRAWGDEAEPAARPPQWSKEHRRLERARVTRLNRLPGPFLRFSDRGPWQAASVTVLQAVVVIGLALVGCRVAVGEWFPPYVAVVALALSVLVTALNRRVNARAERPGQP
jgi:hypothetical protein